ncbi:MAG TPA: hypothetical protein H9778_07345 [Candidatus Parabacteroides intestinavium]|jgi:hypothetical protein|nr:hypothetical protein [Candidatus Parabacteroides intestinavium]
MKVTLKVLLAAAIVVLAYLCYKSITGPIEFNDTKEARDKAIIARLMDIRKVQIEYKNVHKTHAGSFDDLIKFLKEEKLPTVIKEGVLTDEQLEKGMTEKKAVAMVEKAEKTGNWSEVEKNGLKGFKRDTVWVLAKDTLLGKDYDVEAIRYVPDAPQQVEFHMDTATLKSGSGYEIKVFVCEVPFDQYLNDLDPQLEFNLKDKAEKQGKYPGLRVGSLEEINNNAGNWE